MSSTTGLVVLRAEDARLQEGLDAASLGEPDQARAAGGHHHRDSAIEVAVLPLLLPDIDDTPLDRGDREPGQLRLAPDLLELAGVGDVSPLHPERPVEERPEGPRARRVDAERRRDEERRRLAVGP